MPRADVLAVRCSLEQKEWLIEVAPDVYFDDEHYRGYPAVLIRLGEIEEDELSHRLLTAWRLRAPDRLIKAAEARGWMSVDASPAFNPPQE